MTEENKALIFNCPHCNDLIVVKKEEINCGIFRHASYIQNTENQINPHASKEECEQLVASGTIYGCAKPFSLKLDEQGKPIVEICDYV